MKYRVLIGALALAVLAACSGSSKSTPGMTSSRAAFVMVTDIGANSIFSFTATATGNITPSNNISGALTTISAPYNPFNDGHGNLLVSNCPTRGVASVVEYNLAGTGNLAPKATISGTSTTLGCPSGIGEDSSGKLYVADYATNSIDEFAPGSQNGDVAPTNVINGALTLLNGPESISVTGGGLVVVANDNIGLITEYAPGASGNVAPSVSITGSNTTLGSVTGLWIDSHSNIWVTDFVAGSILEFAGNAAGNVAPLKTISGSSTLISSPFSVAVDAQGYIYEAGIASPAVNVFAPNASGNVSPVQTITGSATLLSEPTGGNAPLNRFRERVPLGLGQDELGRGDVFFEVGERRRPGDGRDRRRAL